MNRVITTKDLREKFDLPDGTILETQGNKWQQLTPDDVEMIWVRVYLPKQKEAKDR